jgi:hypothetical protein
LCVVYKGHLIALKSVPVITNVDVVVRHGSS